MSPAESVVIRDKKEFERKVSALKKGGAGALHVITDFDNTLTYEFFKKRKVSLSYTPLYRCFKDAEYKKKIKELFEHYHPIEHDSSIPIEERTRHMTTWFDTYFKLVREYGITEADFNAEADKMERCLREGVPEFFMMLKEKGVPVLIFSAGVGNLISFYLAGAGIDMKETCIVANDLIFQDGKITGYSTPLIHTFNKDERHIRDPDYKKKVAERKNVILLGDMLGDLSMSNGVNHECMLKIGFLNKDVEREINAYSENFDAVILNDASMEFVNKLISEIVG